MSDTIYHLHHIVPRHAGGTDDPSNLVKLTIEEHAEAHRKLYEEHGRWQDKLAWQALSGMIDSQEVILQSMSHKGERNPMYGKKHSEATKKIISENINKKQWWVGRTHKESTIELMTQKAKESWQGERGEERRKHISSLKKGVPRPKTTCPHCNKTGGVGVMNRWHFDNCKHKK